MKISKAEVAHIAHLSRLDFTDAEMERFTHQLNDILTYMDKLREVDTEGVAPTAHAIELNNVFREDVVMPSLTNAEALANAPDARGGCLRVPKVVE